MHSCWSAWFAVLGVDDIPRPEISIVQPLDRVEETSITVSNPATIEDEANSLELVVMSQNVSEALKALNPIRFLVPYCFIRCLQTFFK